ncbi:MAG TPA: molybdopterin cofactor-binding domain-containing protein [Dehalococcoidia bacterium]|nr:molybdopterin cofactor-binding domain-containing protein [Dehalococcoidia bacterium]
MTSQVDLPKLVGARVKRREDPRLITGNGQYTDDIQLMHGLHMAVRRSEYGHARITRVDTSAAKGMPGVVAVLTADDLTDVLGPMPAAPATPDTKIAPRNVLTKDKARHVGDPIAVVVAEDRYLARDAVDAIEVEFEELPAVVDLEAAMAPGAPKVHDQFDDNVAFYWTLHTGEVDEAFANAGVVVKQRMESQRLQGVPLETRAILADYQPGEDHLTLWSSTQAPHLLKPIIGGLLGMPENHVRVVAPEVGGGFGVKADLYPEEVLCCVLSRRLGQPVKYVETRSENFQATVHGRGQLGEYEIAATRDGKVTGLRVKILADLGAYQGFFGNVVPTLSGLMLTGVYTIPAVHCDIYGLFTNKTSTGAYRGAGRPEATYYIERMMDLLARELNMDPVELRRRNLIPTEAFPYQTACGMLYESANYGPALQKALELVGYDRVREQQRGGPENGKYVGIGVSTWTEICGFGPSAALPGVGGWEMGKVTIERTGMITVHTGASPHGQGQETSFAQIVADEFGVPFENIRVIHGDTDKVAHGVGTFGSRGTTVGGAAILMSINKVKEKMKKFAANMMDANEDDLDVSGGRVWVKGSPEKGVSIGEVAAAAYFPAAFPPDTEPGLEATSYFEPPNFAFPFGVHAAVVEVDSDTGQIALKKYVAVDDCGVVISPLLVAGQVHGGVAQGVGQAFYEDVVYDEHGQLISGTLMDYALPHAEDFPTFELDKTVTPNPMNPLGAKGIGEAGTIAASPTVVSAVVDALKPLGIKHIDMPLKPERVWRTIQAARPS